MKKYLSLIVVPHDNAKMRNYKVSYTLLYTFASLVGITFVTIVLFVFTYGRVLYQAHQSLLLATENAQLMQRNAQIDSLRTELVKLQTMGIQLKNMLGVGLSYEDSILVANLSPIASSPAIAMADGVDDALRSEQQLFLKAIPSLWPIKGWVTREFYNTGGEKSPSYHPGMDIAAKRNTPVRASAEGVIVTAEWDETYGYMVVIDHGFGIFSLYGHNARNLVKVGDRVGRGQTIAFVGSTGQSTAPHLHFEVRKSGVPVDPRNYLLN